LSCSTCTNPIVKIDVDSTITYTITVTDLYGCSSSQEITIYSVRHCGDVFVPTAFSPNGDGQNDTLFVRGLEGCYKEFSLKIFDRWVG